MQGCFFFYSHLHPQCLTGKGLAGVVLSCVTPPVVRLQVGLRQSTVATPRNPTRVGALSRVAPHVKLEGARHCCTVATSRDITGVRARPRVGTHVGLQGPSLSPTVATSRDLAGVRTLPRVAPHVYHNTPLPCGDIPTPRDTTAVHMGGSVGEYKRYECAPGARFSFCAVQCIAAHLLTSLSEKCHAWRYSSGPP